METDLQIVQKSGQIGQRQSWPLIPGKMEKYSSRVRE